MNTTHLLASALAAPLPSAKPGADNVTGGAKLESEGKAQKTGGKTQNNLERRRRTEEHHKEPSRIDDPGQCLEKCKTRREPSAPSHIRVVGPDCALRQGWKIAANHPTVKSRAANNRSQRRHPSVPPQGGAGSAASASGWSLLAAQGRRRLVDP